MKVCIFEEFEQDCTCIVIDESVRNIIISITGAPDFNSFVCFRLIS